MSIPGLSISRWGCALLWIAVAALCESTAYAQPVTTPWMIGGDVFLNINFYSTSHFLQTGHEIQYFERDFLGHGSGTSVGGSLVCSVPIGGPNSVVLSANLEELKIVRHDSVIIPCQLYGLDKSPQAVSNALTSQEYEVKLTAITLGASYQKQFGHVVTSIGPALGPFLTHSYHFTSTVIRPDSCFYNFFTTKSHSMTEEYQLTSMNVRLPINIRLGILIPVASRMFLAPSIGFNFDFVPLDGSGATISSIQPGMGVRYEP